jgi:hypothetical protein
MDIGHISINSKEKCIRMRREAIIKREEGNPPIF